MNEQDPGFAAADATRKRDNGRLITVFAAVMVLVLALGAVLWPNHSERRTTPVLLVFDSSGSAARTTGLYVPLQGYLAEAEEGPLDLVVARNLGDFASNLKAQPDFVFVPDGLALGLPAGAYLPLVAGRRAAPQNLRPRGVLVARRSAGEVAEPWVARPGATVFGDSVSLVATGALMGKERARWPAALACGPDPYDHGPVLQALRLGAFDFAVVRQWDAERFFAEGLLDQEEYDMQEVLGPVPDAVLMVSRKVSQGHRLKCGERLSALGRGQEDEEPQQAALLRGLALIRLAGFNLLLEPDFELVRRKFPSGWLSGGQ